MTLDVSAGQRDTIDSIQTWDRGERRPAIRRAVEDFVAEVDRGRTSLVASLLAGNLQELLGVERLESIFSESHEEIRARGGVARIEFVNLSDDDTEARVDIRIVYGDGSYDEEEMVLVPVPGGGDWRIDMTR